MATSSNRSSRRSGETQATGAPEGVTSSGPGVRAKRLAAAGSDIIHEHLASAVDLDQFLQSAGTLTLDERTVLVDQALVLFEQNYVHLPLKVAMHAVNPLQRLRLLRARLERQAPASMEPEWLFHAELSEIFHSVRDLHTNYLLPAPFNGKIAYLPFQVEEYFDGSGPHFVVARLVQGFSAPGFGPGAELTHWSGVPIGRAVERNAARFAGSNAAARHARGLESLTIRALRIHLPPDEQWVTVSYVGTDGANHELREKWRVVDNLPPLVASEDAVSTVSASLGLDLGADEISRAKKLLFVPQVVAEERAGFNADLSAAGPAAVGEDIPTTMAGVFRARSVATASGTFGHLRIFTFSVDDPDAFAREVVRLLGLLPQNGLIVDVRGNGGGHIYASEFTLQTLTPDEIEPEPVQFINTPLNLRICRRHRNNPTGQIDLGPWTPSMEQALETGAGFSAAFPITPRDGANAVGQVYHGPVVLITDARCYSATDIFAAGFQDHHVGVVLGVDDNTGAGGANVWTHGLLQALLEVPTPDPASPYQPLPKQANMRVAIRRSLRVKELAGTVVEDLGVVPDERHRLTRNDVLAGNVDVLERAGQLLTALPVRKLVVTTAAAGGDLTVRSDVANVERADVYVDGRPRASVDIAGNSAVVTLAGSAGAGTVRVEGYAGGKLVAARTVRR